jgi:hypothetical protein
VPQTTNVLFDWLLSALSPLWGYSVAQRLAVSLAVLVFFWGAFAWLTAVAGRQPRHLTPLLAVLAYGWVFHAGFFNFYWSLGLCFCVMSLAWRGGPRRLAIAAPLVVLAWLAHNLPVVWMMAIGLYAFVAPRLTPRARAGVIGAVVLVFLAIHVAMRNAIFINWYPRQLLFATGMEQAWIYTDKYLLPVAALVVVTASMFVRAALKTGWRAIAASIPLHLWALTALGVAILPTAVSGRGINVAYISDRMSLASAICLCAVFAAVPLRAFERYALLATTLISFGFLYRDDRILNAFEDSLQSMVSRLPERSRVVSSVDDLSLHVIAVGHMIDRSCTGWCYSLANYEASSENFRLRALSPNPVVAATYEDSWRLQVGGYPVQPKDVPLYEVTVNGSGELAVRILQVGEFTGHSNFKILPDLF